MSHFRSDRNHAKIATRGEAMLSELKSVRIIHGYGTGQLRRAIGEFLRLHPYVAHFAAAPDNQGGGGVTVVEFKE